MARKIQVKQILELRAVGMSQRQIAFSRHMSKTSVGDVFRIAEQHGISYDDIRDKQSEEVYRLFYPDKCESMPVYGLPDYGYVHHELSRTGVTLKLLWKEYRDKCNNNGSIPVGYTKFCTGYTEYTTASKLTSHLLHKPGIVTEVDWSGSKMSIVDRNTSEVIPVYLFVATLPYSQYSYVEPCLNMKQETWLRCHVHMFEFWGGTTIRTVCDNLKVGVIEHPREGDIILNEAYEALGSHYFTAIMPAQVRKPKQKASVEGTVGKIATAIIARLRNEIFYSLDSLKIAVFKRLKDFNDEPFQKRSGSRTEVFRQEEKRHLRELPALPYEIAQWFYGRKANLDSHIAFQNNRYSCPYQYVGKEVDLKVTDTLVEIYYRQERINTHRRFPEYVTNQWSTHPEDMPDHLQRPEWDDERIRNWARSIGSYTSEVIERIFSNVNIKEQGYNSCLSVLRLSKTYSNERLETACELALTKFRSPRYRHLKAILDANQDQIYLESHKSVKSAEEVDTVGYVRGPSYYGGRRQ
ncbi:MAG: IS21 family transposase [Syntrophomonadaceae bacterium]|nr:IS21 family transposase [Syntrophomonadaceae bacterium]